MEFDDSLIKREITLWIHNLMVNNPNNFSSYENLEGHIRNHMINQTTKFISCNRKDMESIYNHYKKANNNVG